MNSKSILEKFPEGSMVISRIGKGGPNRVFVGHSGEVQPFDYMGDYNPDHYRLMSEEEYLDPSELVKNGSIDAYRWAKSFMYAIDSGYFDKKDIDEKLMITWFANAIEVAREHG